MFAEILIKNIDIKKVKNDIKKKTFLYIGKESKKEIWIFLDKVVFDYLKKQKIEFNLIIN